MSSRGVVWLGSPSFPEAARTALADGQLRANLKRATATRATSEGVPSVIAQALTERGAQHLALPAHFPGELLPSGSWGWHREPRHAAALDVLDGAVTLAVTGTIVLDTGPGQGRRALALVPDYHLCVIRADQIADDVPERGLPGRGRGRRWPGPNRST